MRNHLLILSCGAFADVRFPSSPGCACVKLDLDGVASHTLYLDYWCWAFGPVEFSTVSGVVRLRSSIYSLWNRKRMAQLSRSLLSATWAIGIRPSGIRMRPDSALPRGFPIICQPRHTAAGVNTHALQTLRSRKLKAIAVREPPIAPECVRIHDGCSVLPKHSRLACRVMEAYRSEQLILPGDLGATTTFRPRVRRKSGAPEVLRWCDLCSRHLDGDSRSCPDAGEGTWLRRAPSAWSDDSQGCQKRVNVSFFGMPCSLVPLLAESKPGWPARACIIQVKGGQSNLP